MSKRFVLTLLCSALFIPFTLQTASAQPSCDPKTVREVFHKITELQEEQSLLESRTNRLLRALYNRGAAATEDLQEEYDRVKSAGAYHQRLCHEGQLPSCIIADRLEHYAAILGEAIALLRFDITEAMDALVTRFSNIADENTEYLERATTFIRECLSDRR